MKSNLHLAAAATLVVPLGGAAIVGLQSCAKANAAEADQKPYNIVYIMTDDHTAQMMSCYDKRYADTPNLDRIARDGVIFSNSYVANSLSGPARACVLTGKHSHANGFLSNEAGEPFNGDQPTFPKYLQDQGYQTAIFGKWHLISNPTGFDTWCIVPEQGDYYNPTFINMDGSREDIDGYVTNIITDKSLDWLEKERDPNKPFLLMIHHKAQHRNWMADTCNLALYEDKTFPLPDNFFDDYEGRPAAKAAEMRIDDPKSMDIVYDLKMLTDTSTTRLTDHYLSFIGRMNPEQRAKWDEFYKPIIEDYYKSDLKGKELAEWRFNRYMRDYLKTLKSLDDNVGRVLDYLDAHGLKDNTLVVYTSDQGFYMGEHGWFDKRFMYQESFSTPLIMRLPKGLEARGEISELVQNIDYAPTFMEIAGVKETPKDIHGQSLLPLLKSNEKPKEWRDQLYYHYHEYPAEHMAKRHYGVRDERYKLIHFYNDIDHWELYDLQEDPTEMHNLYGKPGMEEVTKKMRQRLKKAMEQYDDPIRHQFPIND